MICPVCDQPNADDAHFCGSCGTPLEDESAHVQRLIGETIGGRYRIKRVIGEGGMGVVYEAEQQMGPASRTVAVKTLLPWMSKDPSIRSRFYREGGIVSALEHPNTVRVFDFGEAPDGSLYIAMEFVRGEPLTALIHKGPIEAERTRRILRQVCGALEEAHQQGIIHRDLKPDNIILTTRGADDDFVKVLDFGIAARTGPAAKSQTKLTKLGMVLGTPPYMSPEQLAGQEVDSRSDVYSLGIIAYEMLTGQLPFEAETPWQWANKHMTEVPRSPTTITDRPIPAEFERAVMCALAKNPQERPKSAIAFYRMLTGELAPTEPEIGAGRTTPMPAPPDFGARGGTEIGGPAPIRTGAAVAAPIPPPPPSAETRRGRWLGWAFGLTGVAAVVTTLFALGVVELPPGTRTASPPPVVGAAGASPTDRDAVEIAPLIPERAETPIEPAPSQPSEPSPAKPHKPTKPPTLPEAPPVQPPPAQPPPAQPPPTQPPPAQPPPAQPPPPTLPTPPPPTQTAPPKLKLPGKTPPSPGVQGDAACSQSEQAARSGNIEGAVALYRTCASTGGSGGAQANARARIRQQAPHVVKRRAFTGDCNGARSAANAASSIGEGGPAQSALAQTSCQ